MSNIIKILLEEHRNIDRLLLVLEHELEIFDRSEEPDYEICGRLSSISKIIPRIVITRKRIWFLKS